MTAFGGSKASPRCALNNHKHRRNGEPPRYLFESSLSSCYKASGWNGEWCIIIRFLGLASQTSTSMRGSGLAIATRRHTHPTSLPGLDPQPLPSSRPPSPHHRTRLHAKSSPTSRPSARRRTSACSAPPCSRHRSRLPVARLRLAASGTGGVA